MELREVALTDELLRELLALSAGWADESICRGYAANTPADLEGRRIFAAFDGACLVGYLFGACETASASSSVMPDGTSFFELEELYVIPRLRSQGVGRALFRLAEETLRAECVPFICLSTATKDCRAILHFYLDELGMEFWSARLFKRL